ncbi:MAG: PH domain-containing protein [Anaerolineae bacterium]
MVWKPAKRLGLVVGLIILIAILAVEAFLLQGMIGQSIGLNLFFTGLLFVLGLPVLGLWVYWYYGLLKLSYQMDRNALLIDCGSPRHRIPMDSIQGIVPGRDVAIAQGFRGVGWPGYMMGQTHLEDSRPLLVCSTEPLDQVLVVLTDSTCYAISPPDAERFVEGFNRRKALEPIHAMPQAVEYAPVADWSIWRDYRFWALLATAFLLNAILAGIIASVYQGLPERIPLHFDALGRTDRISAKSGLLVLPAIGTLALVVNGVIGFVVHRWERLASYLAVAMVVLVQCVLWFAVKGVLAW